MIENNFQGCTESTAGDAASKRCDCCLRQRVASLNPLPPESVLVRTEDSSSLQRRRFHTGRFVLRVRFLTEVVIDLSGDIHVDR